VRYEGLQVQPWSANDVEYLLTLLRCSYQADPGGAPPGTAPFFGTPVDPAASSAALDRLPADLARLVGAVRERAPRARVVLADYLTVVPDSGEGCPALPMSAEHRGLAAHLGRRLAAATAEAAAGSGAELVAVSRSSQQHSICAAEPWVTGWVFGDVLAGGVAPYHLNAVGMRAVADLLVEHLGR